MTDTLVLDAADRLFADQVTPALVNAAENGEWPKALWQSLDQAGFADALGRLADLPDALAILRAAGRHAVPLPLAETMLARFALRAAGARVPTGALTLAPVERDDVMGLRRHGDEWQLSGVARRVPWSREARAIVALADGMTALVAPGQTTARRAANLAGEPRDTVDFTATLADEAVRALPRGIDRDLLYRLGALCRAAQMAGAPWRRNTPASACSSAGRSASSRRSSNFSRNSPSRSPPRPSR
jgi:acyl-CoA dehydrogenase